MTQMSDKSRSKTKKNYLDNLDNLGYQTSLVEPMMRRLSFMSQIVKIVIFTHLHTFSHLSFQPIGLHSTIVLVYYVVGEVNDVEARRRRLPRWRQLLHSSSSNQICAARTNYCATDLDISLSFHLCTVRNIYSSQRWQQIFSL